MSKLLTVSPSPHNYGKDTIKSLMYGVLIALIPTTILSLYFFGIGALVVILTSVVSALIFEYLITKFILKKEPSLTDGSAIITGLLLAFNVPSNLPVIIIIIGAFVAIAVAKMSFGGLGNNPFNPALVGRVFLLISFPVQMTSWPLPIQSRMQLHVQDMKWLLLKSIQRLHHYTKMSPKHVIWRKLGDNCGLLPSRPHSSCY